MSLWGKIIGGVAGFAMGGPFGAVMGAALGHAAETSSRAPDLDPRPELAAQIRNKDQLFSIGVIVLSAKLAKSDGPVKRVEIDAFKRVFRIPDENMRDVGLLFDRAREEVGGYEPFAARMGAVFADQPQMLEEVLAALHHIARADGPLTRGEANFLARVRSAFRLDEAAAERASAGRPRTAEPIGVDPYSVLGVPEGSSDEEVRLAWRKLMREHHPDSLAARGVPEELMRGATRKVAEINAAWDRIKRARNL
ncbi:TerB family tellurite resistance protein [Roseomonas marmotae]|uniref:TerB family tellurite resistance protein n=1 Tax=Roseomonas marmotae TaxID=2768161 RepID=A0ABS3KFM3_9PROT|nr:TerB family tellurite resistance protein [Roseomonas marmotae]MBO1076276.1 TerB family tellurite resistance protein [Roseomonas marmotae]QTI77843.1 TerB family tellurite resistance protein [Roseomonas marmotae]